MSVSHEVQNYEIEAERSGKFARKTCTFEEVPLVVPSDLGSAFAIADDRHLTEVGCIPSDVFAFSNPPSQPPASVKMAKPNNQVSDFHFPARVPRGRNEICLGPRYRWQTFTHQPNLGAKRAGAELYRLILSLYYNLTQLQLRLV